MARLIHPPLSTSPLSASAVPATSLLSVGSASSGRVELLLILALALALVAFVTALTPARALPRQVDTLLDGRRETVALTAGCVVLAFVLALFIAHTGS